MAKKKHDKKVKRGPYTEDVPVVPDIPPWPERTRTNLILLAILGLVLFRTLFLHPGQLMWANDIIRFTLPGRFAEWRALWEDHCLPFWDPTILCGMSAVGDQARGLTNPLTWLHWVLPFPDLFGFLSCLVAVVGAWGMFLFMRERGTGSLGAFLAAAAFALSGKTAGHLFAGHLFLVSTVLGLPWMLYGVERVLKRRDLGSVVVMAVLFALVAVQGAVQLFYWNVLFVAAYVSICVCTRESEGQATFRSDLARLAGAGTLGALLCTPWWFPVIRQTLLLGARTQDKSYEFTTMASAGPHDLLRHVWPYAGAPLPQPYAPDTQMRFFWETASYPGVVTLVLAATCLAAARNQRANIAIAAVGLVAVLLSLGPHTPFHKLAYYAVPGFSLFRAPGRLLFYSNLVLAILAGSCIDRDDSPRHAWWTLGIVLVSVQLLFFATLGLKNSAIAPERGLWLPLAVVSVFSIAAFLWAFRHVSTRAWQYTCLVALFVELFVVWSPHVQAVPSGRALPPNPTAEYLAGERVMEPFRVLDTTGTLPQQIAAKHGIELITGYHPGIYGHQLELYKRLWTEDSSSIVELELHRPGEIKCPVILDLMNVKYIVTFDELQANDLEEVYVDPGGNGRPPVRTYRRVTTLPRAYLAAEARTPHGAVPLPDAVCGADPRAAGLVPDTPWQGSAEYQPLVLTERGPGDMTIEFACGEAGVLIVSQSWHPDWRAYDHGKRLQTRRVNHAQLAVRVEAGEHQIRVRYVPWDFYLGTIIAGLALIAISTIVLYRLIRKYGASGNLPEERAQASEEVIATPGHPARFS